MNKFIKFFSKYIKFIWLGKANFNRNNFDVDETDVINVGAVNIVEENNKEPSERKTKLRIITQINRLLMIVCITSFIIICFYSLFYPDKAIPDLMQNAFFTTLGWFGGILGAFFQVDQNQ